MFYLRDNVHGTWTHQAINCVCSWLNVRVNLKHLITAKIISCKYTNKTKRYGFTFCEVQMRTPWTYKKKERFAPQVCWWAVLLRTSTSWARGVIYTHDSILLFLYCASAFTGQKPYWFQHGWLWFWEMRDYIKHSCQLLKQGHEAHCVNCMDRSS